MVCSRGIWEGSIAPALDSVIAMSVQYIIISPVRNEAAHLSEVIAAIAAQTVLPVQWILVNDGSTDATAELLASAAKQHGWIEVVERPNRGARAPGTGVMEAFADGFRRITTSSWEYIVKLDGDIIVPPHYMESCLNEFAKDPSLGIGGGTVDHIQGEQRVTEPHPKFHVRGATKIYRRACWDAIGGLSRSIGWDTHDELNARFHGWTTRTFEGIRALHCRPTGAADGSWRNAVKNGRANYAVGYHPLFMFAKCLVRVRERPFLAQALGLAVGFVSGYARRAPRISEPGLIAFTRREQLRRLMGRSSIWE